MVGAAGLGNTLGIVVASLARKINPAVMVVVALFADIAAVVFAAVAYSLIPLIVLGLTAGLMQYLAKVSLDSTIQTDVPVRAHSSAFAKGDTTLQLAWVVGGFLGVLSYPAVNGIGLPFAALVLGAWTFFVLRSTPTGRRSQGHLARSANRSRASRADLPQASSSSASARSSLATGCAVRRSGCRPWR